MFKKKTIIINFTIILVIFFSINFINISGCNFNNFLKSSKDFGLNISIENCKSNIKEYWYISLKNLFTDTIFEEKLRIYKKNKHGSRYVVLKKEYLKKEKKHYNSNEEKPFIKGILKNPDFYLVKDENQLQIENNTWLRSHGGNKNLKFNNSKENISQNNIDKLKLKWKLQTINSSKIKNSWKSNIEINPVYFDNKIIFVSANFQILAVEASSGSIIWKKQSLIAPSRRGIIISEEQNNKYLFINIGKYLFKINSLNGKLEKKFGVNGAIKASNSLIAPFIYQGKIFLIAFNRIISYDIKNGKELFSIDIHPKNKNFIGGVPWAGSALDDNLGILYLVTGNPRPALVGLERPGNNKNTNSIIAFDLNSKKIVWSFQEVAHDLWDFDIASPPILTELKIKNKILEIIVVTTKIGNVLIFERSSGKPLFDIDYKKAPISNIPGEETAKFQINLESPEKLYDTHDYSNINKDKLKNYIYGFFEPPQIGRKLITYGLHGGATWPGSSVDPTSNSLFTPINKIPFYLVVEGKTLNQKFPKNSKKTHSLYLSKCSSCHGKNRNGNFDPNSKKKNEIIVNYIPSLVALSFNENYFEEVLNQNNLKKIHPNIDLSSDEIKDLKNYFSEWDKILLKNHDIHFFYHWATFVDENNFPASKPPWGEIVAMNIKTGKIIWKTKIGKLNENENNNNMTGTINYGGVVSSGGNVIFVTGTPDNYIYGLNSLNGEVIWEYKMNAAGSAPPIIYEVNGKQYLSVISTGGFFYRFKDKDSTIYTFAIHD